MATELTFLPLYTAQLVSPEEMTVSLADRDSSFELTVSDLGADIPLSVSFSSGGGGGTGDVTQADLDAALGDYLLITTYQENFSAWAALVNEEFATIDGRLDALEAAPAVDAYSTAQVDDMFLQHDYDLTVAFNTKLNDYETKASHNYSFNTFYTEFTEYKNATDGTLGGHENRISGLEAAPAVDAYSKTETDTILADYATTTAVNDAITVIHNAHTEVLNDHETRLDTLEAAPAVDAYSKAETDTLLADYTLKSTHTSFYNEYYTYKATVASAHNGFSDRLDALETAPAPYTKAETDALLDGYATDADLSALDTTLRQEITNSGGAASAGYGRIAQTVSGRFQLRSDALTWCISAADGFGSSGTNWVTDGGAGDAPAMDYDHAGVVVPANYRVRKISVLGYTNNSEVPDIEVVAELIYPSAGWSGGYRNVVDMARQTLVDDLWMATTTGDEVMTGRTDYMRRQTWTVPAYTLDTSAFLRFAVRPSAALSTNRFFYATIFFEMEELSAT